MPITGLNRKTIDKYYTTEKTTKLCLELIKKHIKVDKNELAIEPSAGNGAFIEGIRVLFPRCEFYDLEPEHKDITKQNYLELEPPAANKIHIIGNPPFGRQSTLAIKFIKKSTQFCDTLSFILPKSFKKDSLKKHFPLNFHLTCERELPDDSFTVENKPHKVPCVFQIWTKKDTHREVPRNLEPKNFTFVKKENPHDISFRRVGVYAGQIDIDTVSKSTESHYFIKFTEPPTASTLDKLRNINFNAKNDTVGPRSISKQELIREYNK